MLTTLVLATTGLTVLASLVVLATMNFDAENFWDPRTRIRAAASLVRSALQHSQLLLTRSWSQARRASQLTGMNLSQSVQKLQISARLPSMSQRLKPSRTARGSRAIQV